MKKMKTIYCLKDTYSYISFLIPSKSMIVVVYMVILTTYLVHLFSQNQNDNHIDRKGDEIDEL